MVRAATGMLDRSTRGVVVNPLAWDAPKLVVYAALFCIVFIRAGATYAAGRGLIAGM